jgi:peptide/nickel transport system substrate-binding protein
MNRELARPPDWTVWAALVAGLFVFAVGSAESAALTKHGGVTKVQGGTAYFAEDVQATPNYIFPFMPLQYFSVTNGPQFQQLMYRPLYWFGNGSQPTLNLSISLAGQPVYSSSGREVTITLTPYRFSNGETVTAQDVVFWFNILKVERYVWSGYAPGTMPDDLASVTAPNATTVVVKTTGPVNSLWFTYNELSQITPFPMAWDVPADGQTAGSESCGTAGYSQVVVKVEHPSTGPVAVPESPQAKSCAAVFTYLSKESGWDPANPEAPNGALKTYATNPLWQVVDGPWKLASFDGAGNATFVPNPSYSGPVKPTLARFVEVPFTSDYTEFTALTAGKITFGYLPTEDVTSPAKSPTVPGANNPELASFNLTPVYPWGINYVPYNFASIGDSGQAGTIFKQLYFRQAFQLLVDQPLYITKIFRGYGIPIYGPVPVLPENVFATSFEQHNPYAYDVKKAQHLLTANGWRVVTGGSTTCSDAAKCGVPAGTPLYFTLQYANTGPAEVELMDAEKSSWAQAGIQVTLTLPLCNALGPCGPCPGSACTCPGPNCTWEMNNWGGGWVYSPDYYPSGEQLFQTGAAYNQGDYSDPTNDANIRATDFDGASLSGYENYLAQQLPVVWQPEPAYKLAEVKKNLAGATPLNPLLTINPENWYFTT